MLDGGQERGLRIETALSACQDRGEVEPEAVHAAVNRPGAQCVHTEPNNRRAVHRQDVAASGIVHIQRLAGGGQPVITGVVQAAHRQRRAEFIALTGMVQHHVHDDADPRRMQRIDGGADLLPAARCQPWVRGEEGDRVIAPVVRQVQRR